MGLSKACLRQFIWDMAIPLSMVEIEINRSTWIGINIST
jgi:hypothetical protein